MKIEIDADQFEHLLNCMAQLDFVPRYSPADGEPIIRKAYSDARQLLCGTVKRCDCLRPTFYISETCASCGKQIYDTNQVARRQRRSSQENRSSDAAVSTLRGTLLRWWQRIVGQKP